MIFLHLDPVRNYEQIFNQIKDFYNSCKSASLINAINVTIIYIFPNSFSWLGIAI